MAERVDVLGCRVDPVTLEQAVERCAAAIRARKPLMQFSANAAKVVRLRDDSRLAQIAAESGLVTADGASVVLASRVLGDPLPERVTGIDLMERLLARAEQAGWRVFVLGARAEELGDAIAEIAARHPSLELAGHRNGYFDAAADPIVVREIADARADLLFVAMGSPRSERWIAERLPALGVSVAMGVGGSVDVLAGKVRRAPVRFQRWHLEWLYRLVQEPRRLIGRNLVSVIFWRLVIGERIRRPRRALPPPA